MADESSEGSEERDEDRQPEASDETPEAASPGSEFLADDDGNVEVVEPSESLGGPEQEFGGMRLGAPLEGRDEIQLTPASFWSRPLWLLVLLCGIVFAFDILPGLWGSGLTLWRLLGLVGLPLVALIGVGYRWWKLPEGPLAIRFGDEGVDMPKGADNPARVDVDYRDIRSLVVMVRGETELLLFETEGHRFTFSDDQIREPNGARLLKNEIIRRVRNHPEGDEILARMEALEERARAAAESPTPVTYVLVATIIAGYVVQYATGAWSGRFGLIEIGANSAPLVADGQWWRLISANFLHGNFLHIFLNGLALVFLGISLERLIGSWRLLLIYLVTAVGGSAGSVYFTQAGTSLGASTALYGLVGAFALLHLMYWREIPPPYRQTVRWWVVILGINFGLSALPMVDAAAHFVGMGVGMALTFAVMWPVETLDPRREAGNTVRVATAAAVAVFAAGLAMATNYAQAAHPGDAERLVSWKLEQSSGKEASPEALNRAAWQTVTWSEAEGPLLERAARAARRAVKAAKEQEYSKDAILQFRDTRATSLYRLATAGEGPADREKLRRAIDIERSILKQARRLVEEQSVLRAPSWRALFGARLAPSDLKQFRAQLIRFLDAHADAHGPYRVGKAPAESIGLELTARSNRLALVSDYPTRLERGVEIYASATADGVRVGAFRVCLAEGAKSGVVGRFAPGEWIPELRGGAELDVVLTDTEAPECGEDEEPEVEFWPNVPSVRGLP